MDCLLCREKLDAYVKGKLAPDVREAFERHLAGCVGCREELEQVRRLHGVLSAWQVPPARPGFETRLAARLREAQTRARRRPARLWQPAWIGVAALVLVAVGGGIWWWSSPANPQKSRELVASAVAQDLDLYDNLDMLEELDLLENWEEIETLERTPKEPS